MTEWEGMDPERDYIERIPEFSGKKSGLPKVREFLGLLGNPDREFQIFHVAGTNGKGSVCAFLTAMLKEAGISCGTFYFPSSGGGAGALPDQWRNGFQRGVFKGL